MIVQRLIQQEYVNLGHAGVQILVCNMREKFWIRFARRKKRSVISKCVRCKRYNVKRLESGSVSLPIERVRDAAVFEIVRIDLAGPLYLKEGKKGESVYLCVLYTELSISSYFRLYQQ